MARAEYSVYGTFIRFGQRCEATGIGQLECNDIEERENVKCFSTEHIKCESGFLSHKNLFSFEDHKTKYNKPSKRKSFLEALNEIENNPDIKDLNELSDEDGSSGNEDYQQEEQMHALSWTMRRRKRRPPPSKRVPFSKLDKQMMKIHQINLVHAVGKFHIE
ncbi:lens epithelium-derived growth factor-like [Corticium candelabrum]|uniref:lens epithelium-derived growth factor-like n=1 Tax=Corticium candelabrum TaxID=121492 RepID=UPI002E264E08|nr:lens epithelium-derived growth factor-like [Corticium candelabrum]